ncbi:ABC transporter ATP-binding protein [Nitritalea halalkaliphila]|nr:ATP-binding cassette domain-containing protein [Nitritalea halalkaliphila]
MHVIETAHLFKIYNEDTIPVYAINDVSIQFGYQEFTCIIGPSGSGKSTLLNLIGGLDTPSRGAVRIAGTRIDTLSERQRIQFRLDHIGFVFQHYNLIPVLTAYENAAFIMQLQAGQRRKPESV